MATLCSSGVCRTQIPGLPVSLSLATFRSWRLWFSSTLVFRMRASLVLNPSFELQFFVDPHF